MLTREDADRLYEQFKSLPSNRFVFNVERQSIQKGRTFSEEAMSDLTRMVEIFIGSRVMARWEATKEPPSALKVTVHVEAR